MSQGYNLKIGQPTLDSLCNQIFELAYDLNKIITIQNITFTIPDNMEVIDYPYESATSQTQVYQSEYVLQQGLQQTYSDTQNNIFLPGMYSQSSTSQFFKQKKTVNECYTASTNLIYTVYKANYLTLNLTSEFKKQLYNLPDHYDSTNCYVFNEFFKKYGTDFIQTGTFGASESSMTSFSENMFSYYNESEITEQINNQFLFWSDSENLDYWQEQYYYKLNLYFNSEYELTGGYPYLFNKSNVNIWLSSIINQPVLVSLNLKSLAFLLPDNETDRINSLNLARKNYFYDYYYDFGPINNAPADLFYGWPKNFAMVSNDNNVGMYFMANNNNYQYNPFTNYWTTFDRGPLAFIVNYTCTSWVASSTALTNNTINNNVYCLGGNSMDAFVYYYDTVTMIWYTLNPPVEFCIYYGGVGIGYQNCTSYENIKAFFSNDVTGLVNGISVSANNFIYLFGSITGNNYYDQAAPSITLFTYDIVNNVVYADTIWVYEGGDNYPIFDGVMFQAALNVDNVVYLFAPVHCPNDYAGACGTVIGSKAYNNYTGTVYVHYGGNIIYERTVMPEILVDFGVTSYDDKIYVIGGFNPIDNTYSSNVYIYHIAYGTWSNKFISSEVLGLGIAFIIDNFAYYFEGSNGIYPYVESVVKVTSLIEPCVFSI